MTSKSYEFAPDTKRGHCPDCGPDRIADVKGFHRTSFDDDETGIWGRTDYLILTCRGCEKPYFQTEDVFSEDVEHRQTTDGDWEPYIPSSISHYPAPSRRAKPEWAFGIGVFDTVLGNLFLDVYGCANAGLTVPAAIAARTTFDRATELLGIDPASSFFEKLNELEKLGKISGDEKLVLTVLVDAGSAAAHRGWRPKPSELDTIISLIEAFLHRTFVLGEEAKKLRASVPPRPTRAKGRANLTPPPPAAPPPALPQSP